jgi:hypothetical protein
VHHPFIDLKKAYDSARREVLYNILIEFGVPTKLVRLIKMCLNETYSEVCIGKHLYDNFPIQSGLKGGDALAPLLFNLALEYAIRKVQETHVGLKLNWAHQMLVYADDVYLLGDNIDTIKKNTETLTDASKEGGLEINAEKHLMLLSHHQNGGQNDDINVSDRCFENVAQITYLGTTVTNKNLIQEEIKRRLIQVILATMQSRTLCLLVCCPHTRTHARTHTHTHTHTHKGTIYKTNFSCGSVWM